MNKPIEKITFSGIFIWNLAIIFYFYECFLRVFTNTIADNIMFDLNLNAEQFSLVGAAFFVSYALMQTPNSFLINYFGVKKLLVLASILCSFGIFLFSFSHNLFTAILSRLIMGFGSSFAFLSLMTLSINWFPQRHLGLMTGLTQLLASIGPILAGAPLALFVKAFNGNWRIIFIWLAIFGFISAILYSLFIKNKPKTADIIFLEEPKNIKHDLTYFLKKKQLLYIILYSALSYAPLSIFGAFWGTLYLQSKNFDKPTAAFINSMIWVGFSIACPLMGKFSDHIKKRIPFLSISAFTGVILSCILLLFNIENKIILILCFIGLGISSSGSILCFAILTEKVSKDLKTIAMGLNNTIQMLFAPFIAFIVGCIIHTEKHLDVLAYTTKDYINGFSIVPILFLVSFLLSTFIIKETFCKSQHEIHYIHRNK